MLLQISEPQAKSSKTRRFAVGIDLGTTNSVVASVTQGKTHTFKTSQGEDIIPSVVRYTPQGVVVGRAAQAAFLEDPRHTFSSVKRQMGQKPEAGKVSAVEVSSEVLKHLKNIAEVSENKEIQGVVITVPAYFDDAQRQATKDAARLAGLKVLRLLNEPTAAAIAYGLDRQAEGCFAVFDLGGGTFDISILRLHQGVFEVLATGGDTALGGDDMDQAIAQWMTSEPTRHHLVAARAAKEALSQQESIEIQLEVQQWCLDRPTFHRLIHPLLVHMMAVCERTLQDAHLTIAEVDEVILVGGATRTLEVREAVTAFFKKQPLTNLDPDRVVALGAAIQADILIGNAQRDDFLLLDVLPLSLGLETMGGLVEKMIERNTTIPVRKVQEFTTYQNGQTGMMLHVVQGERELVQDCRSLAHFELKGIPPMPAGLARISVTFQVDADGLLSVSAEEKTSKVRAEVEVQPSYGLTEEEILKLLQAGFSHAEQDLKARQSSEAELEAKQLVSSLKNALASDGDRLLTPAERAEILRELVNLELALTGSDVEKLRVRMAAVSQATEGYAQRRMDDALRRALLEEEGMTLIKVLPHAELCKAGAELKAKPGEKLLDVLLEHGIPLEHACEKQCACTTCHVYLRRGHALNPPSDKEEDMLDKAWGLDVDSRLSCQVKIGQEPLEVEIPKYTINLASEHH